MRESWNRILLGGEGNIARRNVLWNTAGSAVYALTSMLLEAGTASANTCASGT